MSNKSITPGDMRVGDWLLIVEPSEDGWPIKIVSIQLPFITVEVYRKQKKIGVFPINTRKYKFVLASHNYISSLKLQSGS